MRTGCFIFLGSERISLANNMGNRNLPTRVKSNASMIPFMMKMNEDPGRTCSFYRRIGNTVMTAGMSFVELSTFYQVTQTLFGDNADVSI